MNRTLRPHWLATAAALLLAACASSLPDASPPLADFDEPLDLRAEPADEAARAGLPAGCFSGLEFATSGDSLQSRLAGDEPLRIARVIENSPAEAAGLAVDDLLPLCRRRGSVLPPAAGGAWPVAAPSSTATWPSAPPRPAPGS